MSDYRVELEAYNGPLDLLLYLIRREEVDIYDIPIASITATFIEHIEVLQRIDPDAIGDFLVMAATLMEIKSRTLLPHPPAEEREETFIDPRMELVQQLLEYKRFKDAARGLGVAAEIQALKFPRHPAVPPAAKGETDLEHVQLWDLVEAFKRLLEQTGQRQRTHDVVYDDTPIALHAADVLDSLDRAGGLQLFEAIFAGRNKSQMIGLFLAMLELIRQKRIRACQEYPFGPISIQLLDASPIQVDEEAFSEGPTQGEGLSEPPMSQIRRGGEVGGHDAMSVSSPSPEFDAFSEPPTQVGGHDAVSVSVHGTQGTDEPEAPTSESPELDAQSAIRNPQSAIREPSHDLH